MDCSRSRDKGSGSCEKIKSIISAALTSEVFSDLSFDYSGIDGIRVAPEWKTLSWSTWSIAASDLEDFPRADFDFIIVDSGDDPNGY